MLKDKGQTTLMFLILVGHDDLSETLGLTPLRISVVSPLEILGLSLLFALLVCLLASLAVFISGLLFGQWVCLICC